jgi:hypothetical protein
MTPGGGSTLGIGTEGSQGGIGEFAKRKYMRQIKMIVGEDGNESGGDSRKNKNFRMCS